MFLSLGARVVDPTDGGRFLLSDRSHGYEVGVTGFRERTCTASRVSGVKVPFIVTIAVNLKRS